MHQIYKQKDREYVVTTWLCDIEEDFKSEIETEIYQCRMFKFLSTFDRNQNEVE